MIEILKGMSKITCSRERTMALECWTLLHQGKLTDLASERFDVDTAEVYFNTGSGNVFLSDEDYNTVMECDGELDLHISTPYNGEEGFFDEVMDNFEDMHNEDKEYMRDVATDELKEKYKKQFDTIE